jgi:thioredoxin-related protein
MNTRFFCLLLVILIYSNSTYCQDDNESLDNDEILNNNVKKEAQSANKMSLNVLKLFTNPDYSYIKKLGI